MYWEPATQNTDIIILLHKLDACYPEHSNVWAVNSLSLYVIMKMVRALISQREMHYTCWQCGLRSNQSDGRIRYLNRKWNTWLYLLLASIRYTSGCIVCLIALDTRLLTALAIKRQLPFVEREWAVTRNGQSESLALC